MVETNMRKKIMSLISIFLITIFIGTYGYSDKPNITSLPNVIQQKEDPFGVYDPCAVNAECDFKILYSQLKEAGVGWADLAPSISLIGQPLVDYLKGMEFQILADTPANFDLEFKEVAYLPTDLVKYSNQLKEFVEKYSSIKYWQIVEEADIDAFWNDTPENYAILLRVAYKTIKEANPEAKVVLGKCINCVFDFNYEIPVPDDWFPGRETVRKGFYLKVLEELRELEKTEKNLQGGNKYKNNPQISKEEYTLLFKPDSFADYFDIIAMGRNIRAKQELAIIKNAFKSFDYLEKPIWIIDVGFSGGGFKSAPGAYVSPLEILERQGAATLIKTYSQILSLGIEKIFYNGGFFDIDGSKRLEWFTHKLMAEKLRGFTSVEKLAEGQYKFTFKDKNPIWALWNDGWVLGSDGIFRRLKTITFDVGNIPAVKITKAIPRYNVGKEVKDYNTAFETKTTNATNGKITLTLDENPVYVEEE